MKRAICLRYLILAALLALALQAVSVFADDNIVFDDYVNGMAETEVDEDFASETDASADEVYQENNDGDDTYISNNGTVFRIPRVADTTPRIYDFAGLYSEDEIRDLTEKIRSVEEDKNADVIILTADDVPRDAYYSVETSMRYARQFLIDNHFKENSFICIIDMSNRVFWAVGYGKYGTERYSGWGQKVYDMVKSSLTNRDYDYAARIYIDQIKRLDNPLMAAIPTALSLIISGVLSLIGMLGFNMHHKSSQPSKANTPAVHVDAYRSVKHDEHYLGTTVHRRHIERYTGSGGGGGGGGFSGGGFSSGSGGSSSGGGGHF